MALWRAMNPATDKLWIWDQWQMKEHIKLCILSGGWVIGRLSWLLCMGVKWFLHSEARDWRPTTENYKVGKQTLWATDAPTGMLWTWGLVHMKEDIKLHILAGGWIFLRGSGVVGAGGKVFSHTNPGEIMPECWFKRLANQNSVYVSARSDRALTPPLANSGVFQCF